MTNAPLCISMCLCSGDGRRELMYFLGVLSNMKDSYFPWSKVHIPVNELGVSRFGQNVGRWSDHVGFLFVKILWCFVLFVLFFAYTEDTIYLAFYLWDTPYKSHVRYSQVLIIMSVNNSPIQLYRISFIPIWP